MHAREKFFLLVLGQFQAHTAMFEIVLAELFSRPPLHMSFSREFGPALVLRRADPSASPPPTTTRLFMAPRDQPNTHLVPAHELNVVPGKLSDTERAALPDRFSKLFLAHLERAASDSTLLCPRIARLHDALVSSSVLTQIPLVCVEETRMPDHPAPLRVVSYHMDYLELVANVIQLAEGNTNTIYYMFYLWTRELEKELRGWFVPLKVAAPHHWYSEFQAGSDAHVDLSPTFRPEENSGEYNAMLQRLALEFMAVTSDPLGLVIARASRTDTLRIDPVPMPAPHELEALAVKIAHHIELDVPDPKRAKADALVPLVCKLSTDTEIAT